ncbi:MAG: hypothetical protein ACJAT1_000663 [Marivirga sp.]|jgi:hypothetical protein
MFLPTKAAYENLKAQGIRLITNDSLRNQLEDLYESKYIYVEKYTDLRIQYDYEEFERMYQRLMTDFALLKVAKHLDYNALYENQQFKNLVAHKIIRHALESIPLYESRVVLVRKIVTMINRELIIRQ